MDESTGALDPSGESQLLHQLLSDRYGKTTILISHRLHVIQHADWVIVLNEGRVSGQGLFEDLKTEPGSPLFFLTNPL